ncbi:tubulin nucleotide-binding domain-like protein [Suhomyces tanzawaensis NRRL Y-17324]|uniref:Protein DML1 n=1 Tax=Suhomyces tanzawaensis NRRL Y-17324 TaxID=984487 RepID=A0A1E4SIR5_9ASCO|nr:tubulin nucleotide-binding domain-like protein [Suhomyces tanzawaensis NRRL Y-17324]ODV79322.1 tubulin nucleotide-binding domain-like protein [Suhomyces tanzawaensis NRRL Y-17324]
MSEAITISLSQQAGHVTTHLYNTQESHIPYKKTQPVHHNNSVFLTTSKNGNHTNYAPRSVVYDFKGGFGALNKHEYHEKKPNFDGISKHDVQSYHTPGEKTEYQINLDRGITDGDVLNENNTKFWSDYNKLIYNPKSLFTLENYVYNGQQNGVHKNFANLKFSAYNIGKEELNSNDIDDQLDRFRFYLEQCDLFQGLNVIGEIDNGWGGFGNQLMEQLLDEYFNGGISNSKNSIWYYGLSGAKPNLHQTITRIKSTIELSKNSTLFLPINTVPTTTPFLSEQYSSSSLWHTSSLPAMFISSLWGLQTQLENLTSMAVIEENLLRGYSSRKFVNEIKLHKIEQESSGSTISNVDINAYFNLEQPLPPAEAVLDLSVRNLPVKLRPLKQRKFVTNYVVPRKSALKDSLSKDGVASNIYENHHLQDIIKGDTFPSKILGDGANTEYYSEFNISTSFRDTMKGYKVIISNIRRNNVIEVVEEKEELIEDINGIIDEYTVGYEDSDLEDE